MCLYLGATLEKVTGRPKRIFERFVRATNCDYQFEGAWDFRLCRRSLKLTAVGSSFSAAWVMDLLSMVPCNFSQDVATHEQDSYRQEIPHHLSGNWVAGTGSRPQSLKQRSGLYGSGAEFDLLLLDLGLLTLMD